MAETNVVFEFIKSVIFKGKRIAPDTIINTEFVDASDIRILLNCGCAVKVADAKPQLETAELKTKVETAVVVSKKSKKR